METNVCQLDDCDMTTVHNSATIKYCWKHYARVLRYGDPYYRKVAQNKGNKCLHCNEPAFIKGICKSHYTRKRRYGNALGKKVFMKEEKCKVENCKNNAETKWLCLSHYVTIKRGRPKKYEKYFDLIFSKQKQIK